MQHRIMGILIICISDHSDYKAILCIAQSVVQKSTMRQQYAHLVVFRLKTIVRKKLKRVNHKD